jgi:hypothetical protein
VAGPRSGFGGATTVKPRLCRRSMTALHPEPSAQSPCTSTIVGLGSCPAGEFAEASPPAHCGTSRAPTARTAATMRMRPDRRVRFRCSIVIIPF